MDYIVFIAQTNGNIQHYGMIENVIDIRQAKKRLTMKPTLKNKTFYLVKATEFNKVLI